MKLLIKKILLSVIIIALGLFSRHHSSHLPHFIATYAGDTLYATLILIFITILAPTKPVFRQAILALCWCFTVEFLQLWQNPILVNIRSTTLGALILGKGFLATDLICYICGILIGILCVKIIS